MIDQEAALGAPFDPEEIEWKAQAVSGSRALAVAYIDARAVMDRLDRVVGAANWQDEYAVLSDGCVACTLSLRLGGDWVSKTDVGGESDQKDEGDRRKAAFSDALKRAAVKWGIGRYLYRLGGVWVGYDPTKKQLTETPELPAWAQPEKRVKLGGPKPPAPAPAAALPETGAGLEGRLLTFQDKLIAAGLCGEGELLAHVRRWGALSKLPDDFAHWPPSTFAAAVVEAQAFRDVRQAARKK